MNTQCVRLIAALCMAASVLCPSVWSESLERKKASDEASLSPWAELLGPLAEQGAVELQWRMTLRRQHWINGNLSVIAVQDDFVIARLKQEAAYSGLLACDDTPSWEDTARGLSLWKIRLSPPEETPRIYYVLFRDNRQRTPQDWTIAFAKIPNHTGYRKAIQQLQSSGMVGLTSIEAKSFFPLAFAPSLIAYRKIGLLDGPSPMGLLGNTQAARTVSDVADTLAEGVRAVWDVPGFTTLPATLSFAGSTFWLVSQHTGVFVPKITLVEIPIVTNIPGISYDQWVVRKNDVGLTDPLFRLRIQAMSITYPIGYATDLNRLDSYEVLLEDCQTGSSERLSTGKSLYLTLGCMNFATSLLAHGKSMQEVSSSIKQSVSEFPAALMNRHYDELLAGNLPDPAIYEFLPRGRSPLEQAIAREGETLLKKCIATPELWGIPKTRFVRQDRDSTHAPAMIQTWQRVVESYLRQEHQDDFARAIIENLEQGKRQQALTMFAEVDPVWMKSLSSLPEETRIELIETHLRSLPAKREAILVLLKKLYREYPGLAESLQEVYTRGDALGRRGLNAVHAFFIDKGWVQRGGTDHSQEDQILWGLRYVLDQHPEESIYGEPMLITKPLPERDLSLRNALEVMVKKKFTPMTKSELLAYFGNLSSADPKARKRNLMHTGKLAVKKRGAGTMLFQALAAKVEQTVHEEQDLSSLLDSLSIVLGHYSPILVRPLTQYLNTPQRNVLAKHVFIAAFAPSGNVVFAHHLLRLFESPRLFEPIQGPLLISNILRTGHAKTIDRLFQTILHRRSARSLQNFSQAWAEIPRPSATMEEFRDILNRTTAALSDTDLPPSMLLGLGEFLAVMGRTAPVIPVGEENPISTAEWRRLQEDARREAADLLRDFWTGPWPQDLRVRAANALIDLYRYENNAVDLVKWERNKRELLQGRSQLQGRNSLTVAARLFSLNSALQDKIAQVIPRHSLLRKDLKNMVVDTVHDLSPMVPANSRISVRLARTSLRGGPFLDFMLFYQKDSVKGYSSFRYAFVNHRSNRLGDFVQFPRALFDTLRDRIEAFPEKDISAETPADLDPGAQILIPFYLLQTGEPKLLRKARRDIELNAMSRHFLVTGKLSGLTVGNGLVRLRAPANTVGPYSPKYRCALNQMDRPSDIGTFVHEALHHIYLARLDFRERALNRSHFSRPIRENKHPLITRLWTHPLHSLLAHQDMDTLYSEALAATGRALASWKLNTHLGSPILFSDIDHLEKLGLLPPSMRLGPLGISVSDDPITEEFYDKVLQRLKENADWGKAPEDIRMAQYHKRLHEQSARLRTPVDTQQLHDKLTARMWQEPLRTDIFQRVRDIPRIYLVDARGGARPLLQYASDKVAQVEVNEKAVLSLDRIWVRANDVFDTGGPKELEIVVGIKGSKPEQPVHFSSEQEQIQVISPPAFTALRAVKVTVLAHESELFLNHESFSLRNNGVLLFGVPLSEAPVEDSRKYLLKQLQLLRELIGEPANPIPVRRLLSLMNDIYLTLRHYEPSPSMEGTLSLIASLSTELGEQIPVQRHAGLCEILDPWIATGISAAERMDAGDRPIAPLLGRTIRQQDLAILDKAVPNTARFAPDEQRALYEQFLQSLSPEDQMAIEQQKIRVLFSTGFGHGMHRVGEHLFVERALIRSKTQATPTGLDAKQYENLLHTVVHALLARELAREDFTWEDDLFSIGEELRILLQLSASDRKNILEKVLPHLGLTKGTNLINEYVELAQTLATTHWQKPYLLEAQTLKRIVPFAARHYPNIAQQELLDRAGRLKSKKIDALVAVMGQRQAQRDGGGQDVVSIKESRSPINESQWIALEKKHRQGTLTSEALARIDHYLKETPALAKTTPSGLPRVYRFALSPTLLSQYEKAAVKNEAMRNFFWKPEAMQAAQQDFLRSSRFFMGSPMRYPLEFTEVLNRAENAGILEGLQLPLRDPQASILDASGGMGSLLAPALEKLAKENIPTATVVVTDLDSVLLQAGQWLREPDLRMQYHQDDLAASTIPRDSMHAVIVKDLLRTIPKPLTEEGSHTIMAIFANLNRVTRQGATLTVIDFEENMDLIQSLAGLYGFTFMQQDTAPSLLHETPYTIVVFAKDTDIPILQGASMASAVKGHLAKLRNILVHLPKEEDVEFSLDDLPYRVPWAHAFEIILDGLLQGRALRLEEAEGRSFSLALAKPVPPMQRNPIPWIAMDRDGQTGKYRLNSQQALSQQEQAIVVRLGELPTLKLLLSEGAMIRISKQLGIPFQLSQKGMTLNFDYDFLISKPPDELIAILVLREWQQGWVLQRFGVLDVEPPLPGMTMKAFSRQDFEISRALQEELADLETVLGRFRKRSGEPQEERIARFLDERYYYLSSGARIVVLYDQGKPVGLATGGAIENYIGFGGTFQLDKEQKPGDTFYVDFWGVLPVYEDKAGVFGPLRDKIILLARRDKFQRLAAHVRKGALSNYYARPRESLSNWFQTGRTFELAQIELYPEIPYPTARIGNLMVNRLHPEPDDIPLLMQWEAVLSSNPGWVESSVMLRRFYLTLRAVLQKLPAEGPNAPRDLRDMN